MKGAGLLIAALASAVPGPMHAAEQMKTLARTGSWGVDYDTDACHLLATFGEGDDKIYAKFTRYAPGDRFDLSLYGERVRRSELKVDTKLDFGLGAKPAWTVGLAGDSGKLPMLVLPGLRLDGRKHSASDDGTPEITPEQEESVSGLMVAFPGRSAFRLEFGSLGAPMAAMRQCLDDLMRSWGYDPAVMATLSRRVEPLNKEANWLSDDDYPSAAMMAGHSGLVQFRLDVDEAGKLLGCHVLAHTSPDDFADLTCRLISQRARLSPALDAAGKPVRGFFVSQVRFMMAM